MKLVSVKIWKIKFNKGKLTYQKYVAKKIKNKKFKLNWMTQYQGERTINWEI